MIYENILIPLYKILTISSLRNYHGSTYNCMQTQLFYKLYRHVIINNS